MKIKAQYKTRPVRFLELHQLDDWQIKIYSISVKNEVVQSKTVEYAKRNLAEWLSKSEIYPLDTYKTATLILHEGKEGCFAIINWWIDESMMQLFVYLATNEKPTDFVLYSHNGIVTCVWEMAVLWFERNAWVKHILMKADNPDLETYLNERLNNNV
jgi:hypothetical protein